MLRLILVYIHIVSAMAIASSFALEGFSLARLRTDVRDAMRGFHALPFIGIPGMLLTLASGIYLAVTVWGWSPAWIRVGFGSLLLVVAVGVALNAPRVNKIDKTQTADASTVRVLQLSFTLRTFLFAGIVFVMTLKPPLPMSLAAMGIAGVLGLVASVPRWRGGGEDAAHSAGGTPALR